MRSDPLCMSLIFIEQAGHEAGFSGAVCTEHVKAFSHFNVTVVGAACPVGILS
jgi:hypothetical protein